LNSEFGAKTYSHFSIERSMTGLCDLRVRSVPASSIRESGQCFFRVQKLPDARGVRSSKELSGSDRTLGESSPVVGESRVRSVVQRCVGNQTRPPRIRLLDLGTSGQEYERVGASHWSPMVSFERRGRVASS